ncbi:amino acid ABC transporter substrate-binding protein [Hahella sp. CCB-MM4]|uniref:substrate-binding periplasmic protein n=1 Tax=Hahella sp. (strain CCB-MM4) TaxID=1926491 RepID=UPI000B9BD1EC|nr:transporter substrate-binding domain-containing protein [Hahella sp. CCB-MM4]OZG72369.1 amino acid ABC transporter substrate-binding protein [Hahella sp. CCB-MM4]
MPIYKASWMVAFLLSTIISTLVTAAETDITFCSDNNYWYPFTYVDENGEAAGVHVDIVKQAGQNLGYNVNFKPMLWQECLDSARGNLVHGVVTASYKNERAEYMNYPADAVSSKRSASRVTQVEYIVVVSADSTYEFKGDLNTLPEPVRVAKGYSIVSTLRESDRKIYESKTGELRNIEKLAKLKNGSVITTPEVYQHLINDPKFKGLLKSNLYPISSKSYHLTFAKGAPLDSNQENAIWNEVARLRDDPKFMGALTEKYLR